MESTDRRGYAESPAFPHPPAFLLPRCCMSFRLAFLLLLACGSIHLAAAEPAALRVDGFTPAATDWPWWRGPNITGIAAADQDPPVSWRQTENVLWKTPIPGRGHSCATVVG